ncbi:MAG: phosphate/phosphite/phosphonate ABC transporter substrate-binding protein [Anaerolineae bacterium]|nr:phosphate/phosphite/phosphonate ABC transporter substrate-binding protein [Anaerolineae bacterium]
MARTLAGWCLFGLCLFALSGCAGAPSAPVIQLAALQPLRDPPVSETTPLRVSVAAVVSPRGTVESYQPLLDYLSKKLERPVELVQRRTYAETNTLVQSGEVDLAFVCTSAYITGHDAFDMQLLVAPQVGGASTYHSLLIVPVDSTAQSMADLRGEVFAFTDPMSNSGRVYPTFLVQQLGFAPQDFFSRTYFTYNHDDAIRAVADGSADGAAVDSLVFDYAIERDAALGERVKVIHRSPAFGIPPVVVSASIRPQLRTLLSEIFLNMVDDPLGQAALESLGVEAFVTLDDSAYDSARDLANAVGILMP